MVTHMACIEHYKRALLAYTTERVDRLKHLYWHRHALPPEVRENLSPYEVDFLKVYEQNLKRYAQALDLGTDLTMDAAPPKSKSVQVRRRRMPRSPLLTPASGGPRRRFLSTWPSRHAHVELKGRAHLAT